MPNRFAVIGGIVLLIARRAGHGFEFDIMAVDDKRSYFCLKACV